MAPIPHAKCPTCGWRQCPQTDEPDEIVQVAVALEEHLARDHDMTWSRAREEARGWLDLAIDATKPPPPA